MAQQPHFRYYWEQSANNVIVANLRTNTAQRIYAHRQKRVTGLSLEQWAEWAKKPADSQFPIFRITRAQARRWFTANEVPQNWGLTAK